MRAVHVVVPSGIDDPARPSGGNAYDRRICRELAATGWDVLEHPVPGGWPRPDAPASAALDAVVHGLPDGSLVLVDGLIGSVAAAVLVPAAARLRLVLLVHLPLGAAAPGESAVLSAARAVITTSAWTRDRLVTGNGLPPDRVHVAAPGVDPADLAPGTEDGGSWLCVAAVARHKGHDVLVTALATVADRPWHCRCVGPADPPFRARLQRQAATSGIADRLEFPGPATGAALARAYGMADLLVLPSRAETYGMVVTEALARGLPVVATAVGGVPAALGHARDGDRPGLLVPPGDADALAAALRRWSEDHELRRRLRRAAADRRLELTGWDVTGGQVAAALDAAARAPDGRGPGDSGQIRARSADQPGTRST